MHLLTLAAEAVTAGPESALFQYGAIGIILALAIVYIQRTTKREQDRADRLENENKQLNEVLREKTVPALLAATAATQASQDFLRKLDEDRRREEK